MAPTSTNEQNLERELRTAIEALEDVVHSLRPESMTDDEALEVFNLLVEAKRLSASGRAAARK